MAQTKRKRRNKHRGNAVGAVEARGRTSKPRAAHAGQGPRRGGSRRRRAPAARDEAADAGKRAGAEGAASAA